MKNKNLYIIIAIVVVVVVVVVVVGIYWFMQPQNSSIFNSLSGASTNSVSQNKSQNNYSYSDALKLYGTNRIQFTDKCVVIPNNPTFKAGTIIMLDNRTSTTSTISLDSSNYVIAAYDYALVKLQTTSPLPHTINVEINSVACSNGEWTGRILLQQ
ncbi:MAG: hypothetical protein ABSF55_00375 [Candidatus Staskawiczbacteria bacterium]|jgi:hypothetical protein